MQFNLHVPRILERWLNNVNISKRNCMVFIHVVSQQFLLNFVQSIIFRSWRLSKLYFFFYKGFFIKNSNPLWKHDFLLTDFYNTTFMFSQISVRAKLQSTWPLYKQSLYKCYQVYNDGKKFKTWNRCKTQETQKDKTLAFQKGRKGRLIKTHLNKLVTRHAQYITYNFVSFLKYFLVNLTATRAQLF